ncbi:uncharacterized protein LOC121524847 [Cheilinus undulatus]|uniref:uncharacterized protein LOC121524847 n=1 Tax=Cheilinus undulatus TaxID=241271 RepID=UPI001BD5747C|nr:uncharacterized protein LOC121524847 [Cheilinus undulatus]XP_041666304.1 uncharacterized protein LOC121524847 [Cheilinus undulatus]
MATKTSSRFDHITFKSPVHSGSPAFYQLTPKKENIGTLKRITLGEKNTQKLNKTILIVGETGTGKSTLINALVNYAMGVEWEDNVWFQIVDEEEKSQTESQTSDVIVYQIFGFEGKTLPYSLTIIDTPGYGDTRGVDLDDRVSQRLLDLFRSEDGVHEINVVGLVLKATENRLSDRVRYIFDSVVSLFGKDMENKIVSLMTHSDGTTPENALKALETANIRYATDEENQPVHFLFNNLQNKERKGKERPLKYAYETSMDGIRMFFHFLDQTEPQKLETTVDVLNERVRLKACIQNQQERVELIELQQKEIHQTEEALKKHEENLKTISVIVQLSHQNQKNIQEAQEALQKYEEEMKKNKNFSKEVDEPYKDKEPISGGMWGLFFYEGATCCTKCEENCHYPECTMAWYPRDCEVMKKGKCTSCRGKCPVSDHVKKEWRYVTKTRKVQKTLEDMKEKYLGGMREHERAKTRLKGLEKDQTSMGDVEEKFTEMKVEQDDTTRMLEALKEEMEKHQRDKDQCLEESFQHIVNLEQIALNVDSLSTHVHLDFLIEKMKERGDTEKVQKLEEMKARLDEGARAGLRYKLAAARKEAEKAVKGLMGWSK